MSYLSVLKTFHALLIICTLVYVFILRRYVPILFTGMIGTTFGIVLVLIAAFILEELLIPKEDKLFIAEFESELKDQFCRLSEWHPTVTKGYLPNSEMEVRWHSILGAARGF